MDVSTPHYIYVLPTHLFIHLVFAKDNKQLFFNMNKFEFEIPREILLVL